VKANLKTAGTGPAVMGKSQSFRAWGQAMKSHRPLPRFVMRTSLQLPGAEPAAPRDTAPPPSSSTDAERRQSQKMETLGRLASGLAHDFNNVLTVISGYSQLLLSRGGPDHEMRDELVQIQLASQRAAAFIRQLLCFGSSKKDCQNERVDLNAVVADHLLLIQPLLGDAIELRTALGKGLPAIELSPGQLLQILLNLAANARDAMPRGGQLLLATGLTPHPDRRRAPAAGKRSDDPSFALGIAGTRREESCALPAAGALPSAEVWLRVTDTGCGMDEHVQAQIF
jgi:two-component system cell cycle sensor histidine kinase/response regulator CckA